MKKESQHLLSQGSQHSKKSLDDNEIFGLCSFTGCEQLAFDCCRWTNKCNLFEGGCEELYCEKHAYVPLGYIEPVSCQMCQKSYRSDTLKSRAVIGIAVVGVLLIVVAIVAAISGREKGEDTLNERLVDNFTGDVDGSLWGEPLLKDLAQFKDDADTTLDPILQSELYGLRALDIINFKREEAKKEPLLWSQYLFNAAYEMSQAAQEEQQLINAQERSDLLYSEDQKEHAKRLDLFSDFVVHQKIYRSYSTTLDAVIDELLAQFPYKDTYEVCAVGMAPGVGDQVFLTMIIAKGRPEPERSNKWAFNIVNEYRRSQGLPNLEESTLLDTLAADLTEQRLLKLSSKGTSSSNMQLIINQGLSDRKDAVKAGLTQEVDGMTWRATDKYAEINEQRTGITPAIFNQAIYEVIYNTGTTQRQDYTALLEDDFTHMGFHVTMDSRENQMYFTFIFAQVAKPAADEI